MISLSDTFQSFNMPFVSASTNTILSKALNKAMSKIKEASNSPIISPSMITPNPSIPFCESDYDSILDESTTFFQFNSFSFHIFDGSPKTWPLIKFISKSYPNDKNQLTHIASHIQVKEEECGILMKGIRKLYGFERFSLIVKEISKSNEIFASFIKAGTNPDTMAYILCFKDDGGLDWLVDEMGLMTTNLDRGIFLLLLVRNDTVFLKKVLCNARTVLSPLRITNLNLVKDLIERVSKATYIPIEIRNSFLNCIMEK